MHSYALRALDAKKVAHRINKNVQYDSNIRRSSLQNKQQIPEIPLQGVMSRNPEISGCKQDWGEYKIEFRERVMT